MITVENVIFYTLSRLANLAVGHTYTAGKEQNPFFKEFEIFATPEPILLNDAPNLLNEYSLYVRERLFEDVRLEYFPESPSRMTCLWIMTEENLAAKIQYWSKEIPDTKTLYKISCSGKIHIADDTLLIHPLGGFFSEIRKYAHLYWDGVIQNTEPIHQELLFAGSFTVLEMLDPSLQFSAR